MSFNVLLIGDSCEDEYIYGRCDGTSPEAPVPIMKFSKVETKAGMAGNVCLNLQVFGLDITFLTNSEKITRTRFIDDRTNNQVLRVDTEEKVKPLLLPLSTDNFNAVVVSDYDKGYVTESKLFELVERSNCPVFVHSKKTFLPNKENCFVIVNEDEYEKLNLNYHIDELIIIKGPEGCIYKNTMYPLEKVTVCDKIGVDDIFLSSLVYGYLKYNNIDKALIVANKAYAISGQQIGTYVLTEKDVSLIE